MDAALQWTRSPPRSGRSGNGSARAAFAHHRAGAVGERPRPAGGQRAAHRLHSPRADHRVARRAGRDQAAGGRANEWVLHVRDEAQFLVKDSAYHLPRGTARTARTARSRPPRVRPRMEDADLLRVLPTYPLKCGLSLCVSITLLPDGDAARGRAEQRLVGARHIRLQLGQGVPSRATSATATPRCGPRRTPRCRAWSSCSARSAATSW